LSTNKVLEIQSLRDPDQLAIQLTDVYTRLNTKRSTWLEDKKELRNFLFATSTRTTSVGDNTDWKNSTTLPKLTQIRDNLHANYMSALFPNDNWLKWEAYTKDSALKDKKTAITAYMSNKLREGGFRETVSKCLYDYIDYGNAFGEVVWVADKRVDVETQEKIPGYIGPKLLRTSPYDLVFDPTAVDFESSPKITRYVKTIGELRADLENRPDLNYLEVAISKAEEMRNRMGSYSVEDYTKALGFTVDGFGSMYDYYQSGYVEILEFEGDIHDEDGTFLKDHVITVIDRAYLLRKQQNPSWLGHAGRAHSGWRKRPDNLYAMGPLDNLVGMQYRLDHLENLKADALDLTIHPPLKVIGDVGEFTYGPLEEIQINEMGAGDVIPMPPNPAAFQVNNEIILLQQQMEEMAGAPREAMGVRSPGEKTAFEVQSLQNAAGRIFQAKIEQFEIEFIEPILNIMLESAVRHIEGSDVVRVMDDDLGVQDFITITKADITASGKLRPVGARHFSARAQLVQNLTGTFNSSIGQMITPHVSAKALAKLVEEAMGWERFDLVRDNIGIEEQAETQQLVNSLSDQVEMEAMTATDGSDEELPDEVQGQ